MSKDSPMSRIVSLPLEAPSLQLQIEGRALALLLGEARRLAGEPNSSMNNWGTDVRHYLEGDGTGKPARRGSWCGALQSWADVQSADKQGLVLPYATSRGAKSYTRNVARAGRWIAEPIGVYPIARVRWHGEPQTSDRICWQRGRTLADWWQGHVARVVAYDPATDVLTIVEGNRDNARDKGGRYSIVEVRTMTGAQWRARLYGIARAVG